jgi:hypothetical protein
MTGLVRSSAIYRALRSDRRRPGDSSTPQKPGSGAAKERDESLYYERHSALAGRAPTQAKERDESLYYEPQLSNVT